MSKLRLFIIAFIPFLLLMVPSGGTKEQTANANAQSSHLLRLSVIASSGYGYPGASALYKITGTLGQSVPVSDGMSDGKALYAGFWGAAWTPTPVTVDVAIECPPDSVIPAFSTVTRLALSGFMITNRSSLNLSIAYNVATAGQPLDLIDNGDPASLLGTTPPLAPGRSFLPPEAALEIPAARKLVVQSVDYGVFPVGSPEFTDSCATTITVEPPVATMITHFEARAHDGGVELVWVITTDEQVRGFRLYRRVDGANAIIINDELLAPETGDYVDSDVRPSTSYRYTLGVLQEDDTEVRSRTVIVRTENYPLALHQNYPNPFNPVTTISFTLPSRTHVSLSVFTVDGELINTLVDQVMDAGLTDVSWNGTNANGNPVSSGVYLYKLKAESKVLTKKMVLLK